MLKTPLCDLLGIEKPVFQGGMAWIADASLASAVSEAGGLGIIAAMKLTQTGCAIRFTSCAPRRISLWRQRHAYEPVCRRGRTGCDR